MYVKAYEKFVDGHPQLLLETLRSMGVNPPSELVNRAVVASAAAAVEQLEPVDRWMALLLRCPHGGDSGV